MSEERKTLDQRQQMSDIERLRHSAAHILATAILKIWPEAQFAAGRNSSASAPVGGVGADSQARVMCMPCSYCSFGF